MAKSLYDVVTQVRSDYNKIVEHTSVDVRPHLKKLYEERNSNPIVKAFLNGETTFVGELTKYFDGHTENRRALEECLGVSLPRTMDPGMAMGFASVGAAITLGLKRREINRRNFVSIGVLTAAALAFAGGLQYGINKLDLVGSIHHFERAQFLDNTYKSFG